MRRLLIERLRCLNLGSRVIEHRVSLDREPRWKKQLVPPYDRVFPRTPPADPARESAELARRCAAEASRLGLVPVSPTWKTEHHGDTLTVFVLAVPRRTHP